nr:hypothetical protein Itr_chr15CG05690 [Ipomoea trifida]
MTVLEMEMAASSTSPRCPAKAWVTTFMVNDATRLKMEGPTMCHSFFVSIQILAFRFPFPSSSSSQSPRPLTTLSENVSDAVSDNNSGRRISSLFFLSVSISLLRRNRTARKPTKDY